jgi:hypothetical protein
LRTLSEKERDQFHEALDMVKKMVELDDLTLVNIRALNKQAFHTVLRYADTYAVVSVSIAMLQRAIKQTMKAPVPPGTCSPNPKVSASLASVFKIHLTSSSLNKDNYNNMRKVHEWLKQVQPALRDKDQNTREQAWTARLREGTDLSLPERWLKYIIDWNVAPHMNHIIKWGNEVFGPSEIARKRSQNIASARAAAVAAGAAAALEDGERRAGEGEDLREESERSVGGAENMARKGLECSEDEDEQEEEEQGEEGGRKELESEAEEDMEMEEREGEVEEWEEGEEEEEEEEDGEEEGRGKAAEKGGEEQMEEQEEEDDEEEEGGDEEEEEEEEEVVEATKKRKGGRAGGGKKKVSKITVGAIAAKGPQKKKMEAQEKKKQEKKRKGEKEAEEKEEARKAAAAQRKKDREERTSRQEADDAAAAANPGRRDSRVQFCDKEFVEKLIFHLDHHKVEDAVKFEYVLSDNWGGGEIEWFYWLERMTLIHILSFLPPSTNLTLHP